jgi:excisionase family DNA binding protein
MAYPRASVDIQWDPPGLFQGLTIRREIEGQSYAWKIPYNGVVTQAMAADILRVSLMSINNWVRAGTIKHIKPKGEPSLIPLSEVKKVKKVLDQYGRLRRDALGQ